VPNSSASDVSLGSGSSSVSFSQAIAGLTPATTYYYCAITRNTYGTTYGAVLSFATLAAAPTAVTSSATSLTGTTATLNGVTNPGGAATTGWFRYATASPGTCNDSFGTRTPAMGGAAIPAGNGSASFSQVATGLNPGTTYYYCAITQNAVGMAFGAVQTFTTPLPPTVTTTAATNQTNSSAFLNGTGNPNGATTTGYFRYSTVNPGVCDDVFGTRAPANGGSALGNGNGAVSFSQQITGLSAGTPYYYCAIAQSAEGTAFGAVLTFTTATVPTTSTNPATAVTATVATLNGQLHRRVRRAPAGLEPLGYDDR
jgi:phosphodiesterase/alkaline phosphatase D-like protein